jgi:hypothetical protein
MPTAAKFAGVEVSIGGTVYTVPPLGIRKIREFLPKIQTIAIEESGLPSEASMEDVFDVMHAAFARNYPDMSREDLIDALDIKSFPMVLDATLGASGLVKVPAGNASRAPVPQSTGTPSTPDSPPFSDGPGSTSTSS